MNSLIETYKNIEDKRIVLLQSGGLDSNVCAAIFSKLGFDIHHLFIDYGQNSVKRERENAHNIVEYYGGKLHECKLELPWLQDSTVLVSGIVDDFDDAGQFNTLESGVFVPMRNAMLLSVASSLADSLGIAIIGAAFDGAEDVDGYPKSGTTDKHPTFVKMMELALTEGFPKRWNEYIAFTILTPVMGKFKKEIVQLGVKYDANFALSWSCYNSGDKPCCKCSACRERAKGFHEAGVTDPVMQKYGLSIPEKFL